MEFILIIIVLFLKNILTIIKKKDTINFYMKMKIFLKEIGKMILKNGQVNMIYKKRKYINNNKNLKCKLY